MARYEHLPLYKNIYDLILYFFRLNRGFAKDFKYGIGQEVKDNLTALMDKVVIANNVENADKVAVLKDAEVLIERIKLKSRIMKDMKAMSLKSYEFFSRKLIDISKQVTAWKKWSETGRS